MNEKSKSTASGRKVSQPQTAHETIEGNMPPQAVEVEKNVLGALLLDKDAYSRVASILRPEFFYLKAHEYIFSAMSELNQKMLPIDLSTIVEELRRQELLEQVGGRAYLAELTNNVWSAYSVEAHAQIIAQKAISRNLITFANNTLTDAYQDTIDIDEQLERAQGALFDLSVNNMQQKVRPIDELATEAFQEIQAAANREGLSGVTSGFPDIDAVTSGWQKSDLIIIAARPAMGKTAFVLSMAKAIAVDNNIPVAIFNLEMSAVQVTKRILSNVCQIPSTVLKNGRMESDDQWRQLSDRKQLLVNKPLFIDDTASLSVFELRTKARNLVRNHNIQLIIIDYLQLMTASGAKFGNREQEVSIISRSLKILAKELNIPIIALSQLNRQVEARRGENSNSKIPQLSDLRESGAIEQDADMVCFIHREDYYKRKGAGQEDSTKGESDFIIAKHRNGPVGEVKILFRAEYAQFLPLPKVRGKRFTISDAAPDDEMNGLTGRLPEQFIQQFASGAPEDDQPF